ncbi:flavin reductase family protein [Lacrimispora aerotolerans]|uniref:flavin reductase family protein n=1 Tax=Lacrimispora aerotolerans TaxID=36832 RepID=UPI0004788A95|nr:flavin reductase [Lacrimispora aerotolerans]
MLREVELNQCKLDPLTLIGEDWMLVCAGNENGYNMMTASWGGIGVMWGKPVTSIVLRPQRYTLEFVDREDYYTLSFFDETYRKALGYCGSHSGRDVDKEKETGLTPLFDGDAPYFKEAKLVLICRKLFKQGIDPEGFVDKSLDGKNYPDKDYHQCFIGEIVKILKDDDSKSL